MPSTVAPDRILEELSDLWVSLGKQDGGDGTGVLRACAMTLIVAADESEDPSGIWETLAALMPEHPSRTILIRLHQAPGRELTARVFAQCWMPFGQRRQICCEQIEIGASDAAVPDLPSLLLPLAVPDLPVILWCRCRRLAASPAFNDLAAIARKVVVDTALMGDPAGALRLLAARVRAGHLVADLAWTRLTRWREMIARVFENATCMAQLAVVNQVRVAFTGTAAPVTARYLGAWLLDGVRAAGGSPRLAFETAEGEGPLLRVQLLGPPVTITASRAEPECAEVQVGGVVNRVSLPRPGDHVLMGEELGILGRDSVFESALEAAAEL